MDSDKKIKTLNPTLKTLPAVVLIIGRCVFFLLRWP